MQRVGLALWPLFVVACGSASEAPPLAPPPEAEAAHAAPETTVPETTEPETPVPVPEVTEPVPLPEVTEPVPLPEVTEPETTVPEPTEPRPAAALDEDGMPVLDPALRRQNVLGEGPWLDEASFAATASAFEDGEAEVLASVDHRRRTFLLLSAPGGRPEYAGRRSGDERTALWLVRVATGTDEDGLPTFRREAAARLYDLFAPSSSSDSTCNVASELRARDLDADGEVELTVIAAGGAEPDSSACGAVAFLVGADDLAVQARFTREHHYEAYPASTEIVLNDETSWIVRDVNGDGHADLHVVQRFTYRNDFMGDWVGDGVMPASHERLSDRREVDCLWDAATDTWPCPAVEGYVLGSRLFYDPSTTDGRTLDRIASGPPWEPAR